MRDGTPSATAQRVAAHRLGFDRLRTDYGDPAADERLSADVAAGTVVDRDAPMGRYLRGRTAFFDRVVVNAIGRDVTQVVVVGAGYDGRALRYAAEGVRWWEVDHPDTQADKRRRLERLGIGTGSVAYLAHDLRDGHLAAALITAGFDPDGPAVFLCEGVAVYLDPAVLHDVLGQLRVVATPGTRLAVSTSTSGTDPARRARFEASVAALGEPARSTWTAEATAALLAATRWREVDVSERAQRAGFVVAAPVWSPDGPDETASAVGRFVERTLHRPADGLAAHLTATYGVRVTRTKELDLGVHRVERADATAWVARVFPAARAPGGADADAALLDALASAGVAAERNAAPRPVSELAGHQVLVTRFVAGRKATADATTFAELGAALARLHALPLSGRAGGAWHHLVPDGATSDEIDAARSLLGAARPRVTAAGAAAYDVLGAALDDADDGRDLPHALAHPDLVPANAIRTTDGGCVLVDWAGAGDGPRLLSLAPLLWAAAAKSGRCVDAAASAYTASVTLTPPELERLERAMLLRPVVLACWSFATARQSLDRAAAWLATQRDVIASAAPRARAALGQ